MIYTGERVIPKIMNPKNGLLLEHIERYKFSRKFCKGSVLDIACGVGYGSELLLNNNLSINKYVGIDSSHEAISYAKLHYKNSKSFYYVDDALNPNLQDIYGNFDTIVSFETIEHFKEDKLFIENLYKLLCPNGTLIISTPFGRGKNQSCSSPFHVYQYTKDEFIKILSIFKNITMYNQIDTTIEIPDPNRKYYIMVAVCKK